MATGSAMFLIDGNEDAKYLYVPVSYGSITLFGNLPATCYAYARAKSGASIDSPLATFDISILDREGYVVAEIGDFAVRQIRDLSLLENTSGELAQVEESEGHQSPQQYESISSIEGARAFERVLANPLASSIVIFPSDFSAYINNGKPHDTAAPEKVGDPDQPGDSNDDVEVTLIRWWKELLGVDNVGISGQLLRSGRPISDGSPVARKDQEEVWGRSEARHACFRLRRSKNCARWFLSKPRRIRLYPCG